MPPRFLSYLNKWRRTGVGKRSTGNENKKTGVQSISPIMGIYS
jgi:hypothetical protein